MATACTAAFSSRQNLSDSRSRRLEAVPLWTPLDAIPYEEMWADDICWLPRVLAGERVRGFFQFSNETMITCEVLDDEGEGLDTFSSNPFL